MPMQVGRGLVGLTVDGRGHDSVLDNKISGSFPASATMTRKPNFVNFNQRSDDPQVGMGENAGEVQQFVKQIEKSAPSRTESLRDDPTVAAIEIDQLFPHDDRLDDIDLMNLDQIGDFIADRGQSGMLNFDQTISIHHIDPESAKLDFLLAGRRAEQFFELPMESCFHDLLGVG